MANTQKLTALTLIAMAARQGIQLVEAHTKHADALGAVANLAPDLAKAQADAASARECYKNIEKDCVAKAGRILTLERELKALAGERDMLRGARDGMVARIASLTAERDSLNNRLADMPTVPVDGSTLAKVQGERFALQGELSEARAEIAALTRTCDRLRRAALQADGATVLAIGPDPVSVAVQAVSGEEERGTETVTTVKPTMSYPNAPRVRVTFLGAQGPGTADKLKARGAQWRFTNKRGERVTGYWLIQNNAETQALFRDLQASGREFRVDPDASAARIDVRDPAEDAADRFHDRIDRE